MKATQLQGTGLPEGVNPEPKDMVSGFKINTAEEVVLANIRTNIRRQLPQFNPQPDRPGQICIVGGGWSLDDTLDEMLDVCWTRGASIIALNGAGKWLMERNIRPAILMVLDARPVTAEFVDIEIPGCKYLIASQCDPQAFEYCRDRDTYIYHVLSSKDETEKQILDDYYKGYWTNVIGGSTVGLRAITLARMLGFKFLHLFGMDSCYAPDGRHHAYPQEANDGEGSNRTYWAMTGNGTTKGREFRCSVWQASQAQNFRDFIAKNGKHFRLHIHGDGLLAHMLKTGAELRTGD
jgi:hypothetical protein